MARGVTDATFLLTLLAYACCGVGGFLHAPGVPAWVSYICRGGGLTSGGDDFGEAVAAADAESARDAERSGGGEAAAAAAVRRGAFSARRRRRAAQMLAKVRELRISSTGPGPPRRMKPAQVPERRVGIAHQHFGGVAAAIRDAALAVAGEVEGVDGTRPGAGLLRHRPRRALARVGWKECSSRVRRCQVHDVCVCM